jgi:hypothetical protein
VVPSACGMASSGRRQHLGSGVLDGIDLRPPAPRTIGRRSAEVGPALQSCAILGPRGSKNVFWIKQIYG